MKRTFFRGALLTLLLTCLLTPVLSATPSQGQQDQGGLQAAELIDEDATVKLTFHKVEGGQTSDALDLTNPSVKFYTNDIVKIRYTAPFDSYVYIVNHSDSGGTTVQYPRRDAQNAVIPANQTKEFGFRLTNRDNLKGEISEDLIVVISRTKIVTPKLEDVMSGYAQIDQLQRQIGSKQPSPAQQSQLQQLQKQVRLPEPQGNALNSVDPQPVTGKQSKKTKVTRVLMQIGCQALSGWLGGLLNVLCNSGRIPGLNAAEYIEDESTGAIYGSPTEKTEKLYMRLSFKQEARQ